MKKSRTSPTARTSPARRAILAAMRLAGMLSRRVRARAPIVAYLILVLALILAFVRVEDVRQDRWRIANDAIVVSCERVDRVLGELVKRVADPNVDPNTPDPSGARDALRSLRGTSCRELGRRSAEKSEGE